MNQKDQLLDNILAVIAQIKEDQSKLEKVHTFLKEEIYEEEIDEIIIPEEHKKLIHDIAEMLDGDHICYLNTDTLEYESIPQGILDDLDSYDEDGLWKEIIDKVEGWENSISLERPESREYFKIMEGFANDVSDEKFANRLWNTLNNRKPFANFNHIVHNSDFREDWFTFKQIKLEEKVYQEVLREKPEFFD